MFISDSEPCCDSAAIHQSEKIHERIQDHVEIVEVREICGYFPFGNGNGKASGKGSDKHIEVTTTINSQEGVTGLQQAKTLKIPLPCLEESIAIDALEAKFGKLTHNCFYTSAMSSRTAIIKSAVIMRSFFSAARNRALEAIVLRWRTEPLEVAKMASMALS